jgi:hypothetical protein
MMARMKKQSEEHAALRVETMEEYLARGGRIKICPPGMRSTDVVEKNPQRRGRKSAKKKN